MDSLISLIEPIPVESKIGLFLDEAYLINGRCVKSPEEILKHETFSLDKSSTASLLKGVDRKF